MFIPLHDHNPLIHVRRQYVTWGLIAVNLAVFVLIQGGGLSEDALAASVMSLGLVPAVFFDLRELSPELVLVPEAASMVTYAFLHGSWMHLAGNMIFLWVFGDNVEDAMGHVKFLFFYLACAAVAGFAQAALDPVSTVPIVGASGAVAGIVGAYLILHPRVRLWVLALGRIPLRIPASWALVAWIGYQVAMAVGSAEEGVAWWAHVAGFVAGAVLVVILKRPGVPLFDRAA
ncbi:rhomboid family intramembrane serine protease [Stappia sp. GBMRC 2046]|uniref:Rhomboid family intramembrane serine protease n=1 Tax=Stappia sediminis TaxID=2692190 RepID=A0A7X3S7K3_9HYPH|nr:rhomboid family intramembrane serine protease [Stappia sediminis]MXN64845.1 rhomboid family intramembrane serine protease [Stappia sediminis]